MNAANFAVARWDCRAPPALSMAMVEQFRQKASKTADDRLPHRRMMYLLGQVTGALWGIQDLIVEDREVQGQAQADGVGGSQIHKSNVLHAYQCDSEPTQIRAREARSPEQGVGDVSEMGVML